MTTDTNLDDAALLEKVTDAAGALREIARRAQLRGWEEAASEASKAADNLEQAAGQVIRESSGDLAPGQNMRQELEGLVDRLVARLPHPDQVLRTA